MNAVECLARYVLMQDTVQSGPIGRTPLLTTWALIVAAVRRIIRHALQRTSTDQDIGRDNAT